MQINSVLLTPINFILKLILFVIYFNTFAFDLNGYWCSFVFGFATVFVLSSLLELVARHSD